MERKRIRKSKRIIGVLAIIILSATVVTACAFGALVLSVYKDISFEADERLFETASSFDSTVFYANGSDGEEYLPVAIETGGSMRKLFCPIEEISPYLRKGFIAVEDKKFYEHKGIDIKRTLMAAANYIMGREKVFGASTITQQVVKNISGDNQVKVKRKLAEIIRAIHLERNYTKKEIFELYLNVIPMSENIYGVGAASRAYFGKEPNDLLPEEAAVLIGITNAPTAYNPYINPDACLRKRNTVLTVMKNDGIINREEYERAINTPLNVISREDREGRIDSWFVERVIDELVDDFSQKYDFSKSAARMTLLSGGYKVYTTMNLAVQRELEDYFEDLSNFPSETAKGLNYAMTVTDSKTGYLVGIIGRVGKKSGNKLLSQATTPHIPASTLKPIALYAPLIDEGRINWATVFDDVPISFINEGEEYREYPRNSPSVYEGLTTVKDAIKNSKNTIAIRLCNIRTPKRVFSSLRDDYGFKYLIEREGNISDIALAPMALGQLGRGATLLEMTEAFGTFPREGEWREAISYISLVDYTGRTVLNKEQQKRQIIKDSTAKIMNQLLMTVTEEGTARRITLSDKLNTAGKTGTSGGNKDKSFIGYTPYYTAGIWCGYDSGEKGIGSLSKSHLKTWDEVMTKIHGGILESGNIQSFSTEGLYYLPYCKDSGGLYTDTCRYDPRGNRMEYGYFTKDNQPSQSCLTHVLCKYDSLTKAVACEGCPEENIVKIALLSVKDRAFPKEINVTDAEYVYRDIDGYTPRPVDYALPYFQYALPEGVFVGRSGDKKQFNSNCYIHDE